MGHTSGQAPRTAGHTSGQVRSFLLRAELFSDSAKTRCHYCISTGMESEQINDCYYYVVRVVVWLLICFDLRGYVRLGPRDLKRAVKPL